MPLGNDVLAIMAGSYWTPPGKGATITYTVKGRETQDVFGQTVVTIDPDFLAAVQQALAAWSNVADLSFVYLADSAADPSNPFSTGNSAEDAELTFSLEFGEEFYSNFNASTVLANPAAGGDPQITSGETKFNELIVTPGDFLALDSSIYTRLLSNIGMMLGLAWGYGINGEAESDIPSFYTDVDENIITLTGDVNNNTDHTIMLQQMSGVSVATPQMLDIQAIQFLYGANQTYNVGDTTYKFNTNSPHQTIWDAGGTDEIDVSSVTSAMTFDLTQSGDGNNFFSVGSAQIWIAQGVEIEGVRGGTAADTLTGNGLNNTLRGMNGNDTISGAAGNDFINGNAGNDSLAGGDGADTVKGGQNTDNIDSGSGNDFINGNLGADTADGGAGNDSVHGGQGNDTITGGAGNDFLYGDRDDDNITGGSGADVFVFNTNSGTDTITDFASGIDTLQFFSTVFSTATQVLVATTTGSNSVIDLGGGDSITLTGVSSISASDIDII